jgi:HxlR-like helix-turn-helix
MGSVIEGKDVVQDTFARAFVALDELEETPPLRLAVPDRPQPRAGPAAQPRYPRGRAHRFYEQYPPRAEYLLTAKGRELEPVLRALKDWG